METTQLTTTSIISLFDTSKDERSGFVSDLVNRMVEGEVDPLKVHAQVKSMEDIITRLTVRDEKKNPNYAQAKVYNDMVLDAAQTYGQKSFQAFNGKFEIKEVGTKYDWSKTEDKVLDQLLAEQKEIDAKVKARQDFLKTVPISGMIVTDESTGDTFKVYPPAKSSTTSVATSLL